MMMTTRRMAEGDAVERLGARLVGTLAPPVEVRGRLVGTLAPPVEVRSWLVGTLAPSVGCNDGMKWRMT